VIAVRATKFPVARFSEATTGTMFSDAAHPATVSAFRLDDYEVTVADSSVVSAVSAGGFQSKEPAGTCT